MRKFRIVQVREPKLNMGDGGFPGWVPYIEYETYYSIQAKDSFFWGILGNWRNTGITYSSLERAELEMEICFLKPEIKVIKTY